MSNHDNVEIVKQVYAAFGKGDLQTLLGLLGRGPARAPLPLRAPVRQQVRQLRHHQRLLGPHLL